MINFSKNIASFVKTNQGKLKSFGMVAIRVSVISFTAYLSASTIMAMSIGLISDSFSGSRKKISAVSATRPEVRKDINGHVIRRVVVDRNVFNSDGIVPEEPEINEKAASVSKFDPNAACAVSELSIEFLGAIVVGNASDSIVTLQERGYRLADHYRVGEFIIGNEQAQIYAIEQNRVVLNNNGKKECIEKKESRRGTFSVSQQGKEAGQGENLASQEPSGQSRSITLEIGYVEDQLGPGFARILESGRLVPFNKDGAMLGFKLVGVRPQSLWKKVGLSSGDVLTSVNGISMAQPDKGFTIFESLQNEKEIRVEYLSSGNTPSILTIEIK